MRDEWTAYFNDCIFQSSDDFDKREHLYRTLFMVNWLICDNIEGEIFFFAIKIPLKTRTRFFVGREIDKLFLGC